MKSITSPVGLLTHKSGFHSSRVIDRVSQSLNCLPKASPLFPLISFPASQISHLRPWEIQYLIFEVYCLAVWKAVDATDNCYRQKDNYRSFGPLSKRMTCLCWFRFKSPDVLHAILAVSFLRRLLFDAWFDVINIVPSIFQFWEWTPAAFRESQHQWIKVGEEPAASFEVTDEGLWAIMADWYIWTEKGTTSALPQHSDLSEPWNKVS